MKIVRKLKCVFSAMLVGIILSLTVVSSYVECYRVQAGALPVNPGFLYVIEVLLASMGVSFSSEEDLDNFCLGFDDYMQTAEVASVGADVLGFKIEEYLTSSDTLKELELGDTVNFSECAAVKNALQYYLDSVSTIAINGTAGQYPVISSYSEFGDFLGISIYRHNGTTYVLDTVRPYYLTYSKGALMIEDYGSSYIYARGWKNATNTKSGVFYGLILEDNSLKIGYYNKESDTTTVGSTSFDGYYVFRPLTSMGDNAYYTPEVYNVHSGSTTSSISLTNINHIYLNDTIVYNSADAFTAAAESACSYPVEGCLYGNRDKVFVLPETAVVTTPTITEQVGTIVENNPDLTAEDINSLVAIAIAEALEEQTGIIQDNQAETVAWFTKIYSVITNIQTEVLGARADIATLSDSITDGSSALELPEEMTDSFTVIEGGGGEEDPETDGDGKFVWFPNPISISKLLEPLINYFTSPFQKMTQALDTIASYLKKVLSFPVEIAEELSKVIEFPDLTEITEIVQGLPLRIAEAFGLEIPLNEIIEILEALPMNIGDALETLEFPIDVTFPVPQVLPDILTNIIALPGIIVDAIQAVFSLDFSVVEVASASLSATWDEKLPFIPAFRNIFNLSFPDTYDYPVIKVQTPSVLKSFIEDNYIIIFDGADFATYFVYIRGIIKAILWVWFAYSLLNRFKVRLHIG